MFDGIQHPKKCFLNGIWCRGIQGTTRELVTARSGKEKKKKGRKMENK